MSFSILEINNLSIGFQQQEAVKNISFSIDKGEILAIVGESGSGKSITSLSLLKLLPKTAKIQGKILFEQQSQYINITTLSNTGLQRIRGQEISMIFQEPMSSLNPVKTCGNQVLEAILTHKKIATSIAVKEVINLFKQVQLPDPTVMYHRYPHEISGGQKQRVMIAMAMSCQPELLICDEPTTALDVLVQKEIILLIKKLQRENGMSVLFISHDLNLVSLIADRIALFYKGEIVELGETKQIFTSPKHPYTKALLACRPSLYDPAERLPVVADFLNNESTENPGRQRAPQLSTLGTPLKLNNSNIILSVKSLQVWYAIKRNLWGKALSYNKAVDDISFEVKEGETLGIVGGSGCGKSTLGRAICQLIPVHSGEIIYKDKQMLQLAKPQLQMLTREIQMIFQDPYSALNPRIPIGVAIAEPLLVHQLYPQTEVREKVVDWLEKVGLKADHYYRYPHEFSGGQRQRIVIARALAMKPSFVIFDESVSALDMSVQAQVLNLLNELKKELGFTSIFISHDLSVVKYLCERILIMNKGKIVERGTADQVYKHPKDNYTQALINSLPIISF